jgi:hypothetical protein
MEMFMFGAQSANCTTMKAAWNGNFLGFSQNISFTIAKIVAEIV